MRGSQSVAIGLDDLHGLPVGEYCRHLLHRRIHGVPEFLIACGLREQDGRAADSVFVRPGTQLDPAWMSAGVGGIGGLHFPKAADRDRHVSIRRGAQLVEEVDIGNLAEEFVLGTDGFTASARRDLKVELAEQITVLPRSAPLDEQRRRLQFGRRGREAGYRRPRHADDEVRAKMRYQVLADERQGGKAGPFERGQSQSGVFDGTESDDDGAAGSKVDRPLARIDARDPPRAGGGRNGPQRQHMSVRQNDEFPDGIVEVRIACRGAGGLRQERHHAEFVQREKASVRSPRPHPRAVPRASGDSAGRLEKGHRSRLDRAIARDRSPA